MSNRKYFFLSLFSLGLMSVGMGCSGGTITDENAALLGSAMSSMVSQSAKDVADPDNGASGVSLNYAPLLNALDSDLDTTVDSEELRILACPNSTPSSPTDGDSDGIPSTVTYEFSECSSTSGSLTLTDSDDSQAYSGWSLTADLNVLNVIDVDITMTGTPTISGSTATAYSFTYNYSAAISTQGQSVTLASNATLTYTPTVAVTDYSSLGAGTLDYSGTFTFSHDGDDVSLSVSTSSLAYTPTGCSGSAGFTSGSITVTDEDSNSVTVTFSSDCSSSVTYNGSTL